VPLENRPFQNQDSPSISSICHPQLKRYYFRLLPGKAPLRG